MWTWSIKEKKYIWVYSLSRHGVMSDWEASQLNKYADMQYGFRTYKSLMF